MGKAQRWERKCSSPRGAAPVSANGTAGGRRNVFTHPTNAPDRHGEHPTEKPTALMGELVALFSQPGQTICDPFMGSGTTGVACAKFGRAFTGIEQDPRWFDIACHRIEQAYRQSDLFVAPVRPSRQPSMFEAAE